MGFTYNHHFDWVDINVLILFKSTILLLQKKRVKIKWVDLFNFEDFVSSAWDGNLTSEKI